MITAKEAPDLSKSEEHIEKISNKVEEEIVKAAKLGERSVKIEFPFYLRLSCNLSFQRYNKNIEKRHFIMIKYAKTAHINP